MIYLSESAARKFMEIRESQARPQAAMRIAVQGGDCAGLKYFIGLDDFRASDDVAIESCGVRIHVDAASAAYLWGVDVEWIEVEDDAGFVVLNPNKGRSKGGCSSDGEGQGCMTLGDGKHCVKRTTGGKCKTCTDSRQPLLTISLLD